MIRLLQLLFLGHAHKWKIIQQYNVTRADKADSVVATAYVCQCEECGALKFRKDWVFMST